MPGLYIGMFSLVCIIVILGILAWPPKMPKGFGDWHAKNVARHYAKTHNLPWKE